MKVFVHSPVFARSACGFNQFHSGEVTLQTVLPSGNCMVSRRKRSSFRSHSQNTALLPSCFDFESCVWRVQGLERRYKMGRPSCIVLYFLQIHLSHQVIIVLKLENPTSET